VKHDLETGESWSLKLEEGRFASEAPFVPRVGGSEEDEGYLVSFIIDENSGTSECILIDARAIEAGPVCRIALPHKISSGTHSWWAERGDLAS
jgi:carotenoid cleavage dioxygenase-like enzyme